MQCGLAMRQRSGGTMPSAAYLRRCCGAAVAMVPFTSSDICTRTAHSISGHHSMLCTADKPLSLDAVLQVYQRTFWTESFVQWSAHGSFLATLHMQGVAIWGGSSFARIRRFSHQAVSAAALQHGPAGCQLHHDRDAALPRPAPHITNACPVRRATLNCCHLTAQ